VPKKYSTAVIDAHHLLRISCSGCDTTWAGSDRAHCGACHETWDSVELYDMHRPHGVCLPPRSLGLKPTKNRIWQQPTD
jgi:hypothetical protein